jgi:hypothetical protein
MRECSLEVQLGIGKTSALLLFFLSESSYLRDFVVKKSPHFSVVLCVLYLRG